MAEFGRAVFDLTAAHRWIEEYFLIMPGRKQYNFRVRADAPAREVYHGTKTLTIADGLRYLARLHGGIERILTEKMRQECAKCSAAKRDLRAAADLIEERFRVTSLSMNRLCFVRKGDLLPRSCWCDDLVSLSDFPEVSILAKIHGSEVLGQELLRRVSARAAVRAPFGVASIPRISSGNSERATRTRMDDLLWRDALNE